MEGPLAEALRRSASVNRSALAAEMGAVNDRAFRLAFQRARRTLEIDGIFFAPRGGGVWERCDEGVALAQSVRGVRASRRRLVREAIKARVVQQGTADGARRAAAERHAIRTETMTALVGEIARKRQM